MMQRKSAKDEQKLTYYLMKKCVKNLDKYLSTYQSTSVLTGFNVEAPTRSYKAFAFLVLWL